MARRMIVLTDGFSNPVTAKLAASVIRYRPNEVVAVFDRESAGQTAQALFGVGGELPVIGAFEDAPREANTLVLGTAPPGGKVPTAWRPIILEAIRRGMNVVSGMHEFLCDDPEFSLAAEQKGVTLLDLRKKRGQGGRVGARVPRRLSSNSQRGDDDQLREDDCRDRDGRSTQTTGPRRPVCRHRSGRGSWWPGPGVRSIG